MTTQPRHMRVEISLAGSWITIDEYLPFADHVENASRLGATVVRTLDGQIEHYIKYPLEQVA